MYCTPYLISGNVVFLTGTGFYLSNLFERPCIYVYVFGISRSFLLRIRYVSDKRCRKNQNTFYDHYDFFHDNSAVSDIKWKGTVELD